MDTRVRNRLGREDTQRPVALRSIARTIARPARRPRTHSVEFTHPVVLPPTDQPLADTFYRLQHDLDKKAIELRKQYDEVKSCYSPEKLITYAQENNPDFKASEWEFVTELDVTGKPGKSSLGLMIDLDTKRNALEKHRSDLYQCFSLEQKRLEERVALSAAIRIAADRFCDYCNDHRIGGDKLVILKPMFHPMAEIKFTGGVYHASKGSDKVVFDEVLFELNVATERKNELFVVARKLLADAIIERHPVLKLIHIDKIIAADSKGIPHEYIQLFRPVYEKIKLDPTSLASDERAVLTELVSRREFLKKQYLSSRASSPSALISRTPSVGEVDVGKFAERVDILTAALGKLQESYEADIGKIDDQYSILEKQVNEATTLLATAKRTLRTSLLPSSRTPFSQLYANYLDFKTTQKAVEDFESTIGDKRREIGNAFADLEHKSGKLPIVKDAMFAKISELDAKRIVSRDAATTFENANKKDLRELVCKAKHECLIKKALRIHLNIVKDLAFWDRESHAVNLGLFSVRSGFTISGVHAFTYHVPDGIGRNYNLLEKYLDERSLAKLSFEGAKELLQKVNATLQDRHDNHGRGRSPATQKSYDALLKLKAFELPLVLENEDEAVEEYEAILTHCRTDLKTVIGKNNRIPGFRDHLELDMAAPAVIFRL